MRSQANHFGIGKSFILDSIANLARNYEVSFFVSSIIVLTIQIRAPATFVLVKWVPMNAFATVVTLFDGRKSHKPFIRKKNWDTPNFC